MLLLNGCSYGWAWQSFPGTNLSKSGGSIARSVRTTIEWIITNGKPDYVFIPLTMTSRFEIAQIMLQNIPIEGPYVIDGEFKHYEIGAKLSDSCYMGYDYAFMWITLLSTWLDSQGIKHLIWDQCNSFDKKHIEGFKGLSKLKLVEANPRVIPLFDFCGNQFLFDSGGDWESCDDERPIFTRHYKDSAYPALQEYITEYMDSVLNEKVNW